MRTIILLLATTALGYVVFQGIRITLLIRKSQDLVAKSSVYERRLPDGSPRILIIGDSTGVGTGVSNSTFSIAGRFGTEFPNASIRNESTNGWKVADALNHFPDVPEKSFDLVLLQIGANDILQGTPMDQFTARLEDLFVTSSRAGEQVLALHSGNIGLAPFFPWPFTHIMRSRTLLYREEYRRIATEQGITYVDLFQEKVNDPFGGNRAYYAKDLLHLSEEGYGQWYRMIREAME